MKKSMIPWIGGKSKLIWIINFLAPPYYSRSIDVFGGSGTVTLNLDGPCNQMRVYNDFDSNLVNLMRCAKERPLSLLREIGFLALNARDEFEMCKKFLRQEEFTDEDLKGELALAEVMFDPPQREEIKQLLQERSPENDIKRAAMYYKLLRYSFSATGESYGGKKCDIRRFGVDVWRFSRLFADVIIENRDFEALIKQYDREDAFIYCDPPYYKAEDYYAVGFAEEDHDRLHTVLKGAKGKVMVSYNDAPEIIELYQDFYIFRTTRTDNLSQKAGKVYVELIITNYDPRNFLSQKGIQLNLFSFRFATTEGEYELIHEPEIKDEQELTT